jgi:hypothetical protein
MVVFIQCNLISVLYADANAQFCIGTTTGE